MHRKTLDRRFGICLVPAALAALSLPLAIPAAAQKAAEKPAETHSSDAVSRPRPAYSDFVVKTYPLDNSLSVATADDLLVSLRNMLEPWVRIYLDHSVNVITIDAPPDQQQLAQQLISALDVPAKSYRLTYTLAERDGGQLVGTQHYSFVVVAGQRAKFVEGSKVPVATGTYNPSASAATAGTETQFTYLDVGINITADVAPYGNSVRLSGQVEQSAVAESTPILGVQEPVIRQNVLEGTVFLTPGKPLMLGSVDAPQGTRRTDISVVMEPVQ